jgi:lipid A 4'-phosphatase
MNLAGLAIALAIAATVGVIFALRPDLDLALVAPFFDPRRGGFWRSYDRLYLIARDASTWVIALVAVPAGLALALKLIRPRLPLLIPARAILLMLLTLALVPGVLANLVLKEHWGRPRPIDVAQFGGEEHFRPWWDPRGDCPKNCSFIAGEPSGAHFFTDIVFAGVFAFLAIWTIHGWLYRWRATRISDAAIETALERLLRKEKP